MNKVFLIGNLTRDPELTETSSGVTICRFAIAVNRPYTGADGERKTDFFNVTAWRALGETVSRYAHKGNKVAVVGTIEIRNYDDSQGNRRTAVDIVAQDIEFLSPRGNSAESTDDDGYVAPAASGKGGKKLETLDDDGDMPF